MGTERARGGSSSISTREARRNTTTQQQHTGKKMPAAMKMRTARPARSAKKVATRGRTARAVSTSACMLVWKPRIQFETFSYLPPLSDDDIKKQIAYMLRKGLTPCLEFDCAERSFAKEQPAYGPGFYYNRYWMSGSSRCSAAPTVTRFSRRWPTARRSIRTTTSGWSASTPRSRCRWRPSSCTSRSKRIIARLALLARPLARNGRVKKRHLHTYKMGSQASRPPMNRYETRSRKAGDRRMKD